MRNVAAAIQSDIKQLAICNTPAMRAIRRGYSHFLKSAKADFMLHLAHTLREVEAHRWFAYELLRNHPAAFARVDAVALEHLGCGLNSWWTVDAFARILSGPVWLKRQIADKLILKWARSLDPWWRRAIPKRCRRF